VLRGKPDCDTDKVLLSDQCDFFWLKAQVIEPGSTQIKKKRTRAVQGFLYEPQSPGSSCFDQKFGYSGTSSKWQLYPVGEAPPAQGGPFSARCLQRPLITSQGKARSREKRCHTLFSSCFVCVGFKSQTSPTYMHLHACLWAATAGVQMHTHSSMHTCTRTHTPVHTHCLASTSTLPLPLFVCEQLSWRPGFLPCFHLPQVLSFVPSCPT
jgi:hypothetical protein